MKAPAFWMFFDVESVGLHGEGFAVAWVVLDAQGVEQEAQRWACSPSTAKGSAADRNWVAAHIPPLPETHATPMDLRAAFWARWLGWRERGAWLVADCPWPVEAGFLSACIADAGSSAHWQGPYPLLDVSTLVLAAGQDPREQIPRLPDSKEWPAHDPLADVYRSIRRWRESVGPPLMTQGVDAKGA